MSNENNNLNENSIDNEKKGLSELDDIESFLDNQSEPNEALSNHDVAPEGNADYTEPQFKQPQFAEDVIYFDNSETDAKRGDEYYEEQEAPKKQKRVSLKALIISLIAVVVATVMLTYSICSSIYKSMYAKAYADANSVANLNGGTTEIDLVAAILNSFGYDNKNFDDEKMMNAAIDAYIAASGDLYAEYYTKEELEAFQDESAGKLTGIGINIINDTLTLDGEELLVLNIVNVMDDSPALEAGIKAGDLIFEIEIDGAMRSITEIGFNETLSKMTGPAGSTAKISVLRRSGEAYEKLTFSAVRREVITTSVYTRVYSLDSSIGIIRISTFDDTTPDQFDKAISSLRAQNCNKFVIDLRYNPGGALDSTEKLLSFFLNKGDVFIQMKNNKGAVTKYAIGETSNFAMEDSACSIDAKEIGKYRDLDMVILCNKFSASASEVFISAFKDYNLAPIVGVDTYGKGTVQSTYLLDSFVQGATGAVSLTTDEFLTPNGAILNKVGVKIDSDKFVALSPEAEEYSVYELPDELDNQLEKAVKFFE